MSLINFPILYIPDPDKGRPLFNGQIYVGEPNLDPTVIANQKQLSVIQQDGTKVNVSQPFTLSAGGGPQYLGNPVRLDVAGNYSIKILSKIGAQVYYIENVFEGEPATFEGIINDLSQAYEFETLTAMLLSANSFPSGKKVTVTGNAAKNDGGGANWEVVLTSSVTPNGTYIRQSVGIPTISFVYRPLNSLVNINCFRSSVISDDLNILAGIELAKAIEAKTVICTGSWIIPLPSRSSAGFSTSMTWNYSILIDGFDGEIDFSGASFISETNSITENRATLFVLLNVTGVFKTPSVDGKLSDQFVGSAYVDDCVLRVGGGCHDLDVILNKPIKNWKGHGIIIRNYGTQDGFASVEAGIPKHIVFSGAGVISGMWQSGYVPITGYGISCWATKIVGCGNNNTYNSQQATTGHNFHQEAVSNGSNDPFIKDVFFYEVESDGARQHGIMIHTAINNTRIVGGISKNNGENGARYEGFCNGLDVDGLVVEDNGGHGEFVSLSTAGWLDIGTKDVAATIRSIRRRNGEDGVRENSGGSVQISGYSGYNNESGVVMATSQTDEIKQVVRDMVIINNGITTPSHGISPKSALCNNVRIVNQDTAKYNQIPILFTGDNPSLSGISISGDSPSGFDFDYSLTVSLPNGGMGLDLHGDLVNLFNDQFVGGAFPNGTYDLPVRYAEYTINRANGAFPIYRLENITSKTQGLSTIINYIGSANNIELRTRGGAGTINSLSQPFLMQAATKYRITYETGNLTAVVIT